MKSKSKSPKTEEEEFIKEDVPELKNVLTAPHWGRPIGRNVKPSLLKKQMLAKAKAGLAQILMDNYNVTKKEALDIVDSDDMFQEILKYEDMYWTVRGLRELTPRLFSIAMKKAKQGYTNNAKDAVVALGILREKLIENKKPQMKIGGKNVQVNLGWKFKPYKSK